MNHFRLVVIAFALVLTACPAEKPPEPTVTPVPTPEAAKPEPVVVAPAVPAVAPAVVEPEAAKPEVANPEAAKPEVAKPEVAKPEAAKVEVAKADVAKAEAAKLEVAKADVAKAEAAKAEAAKAEAAKVEVAKADAAKVEAAKVEVAKAEAPKPAAAGDGAPLYASHCKSCHGADGSKTKMGAKTFAALKDASWQAKTGDAVLAKIITGGAGTPNDSGRLPMPAFSAKLDAKQVQAVVAFIRTLK